MSAVHFIPCAPYSNGATFHSKVCWFLIDRALDSEMSIEALSALSQKMQGDLNEDFNKIQAKAESGDLDAQLQLGIMHYYGWGVHRCDTEALYWFEKVAKKKSEAEPLYLAIRSKEESNPKEALTYFLIAARQGNPFAQRQAGEMLYSGWGVERNEEQALFWFERAAGERDLEAYYLSQAIRFKSGRGLEQSDAQARDFFSRAASLGNPIAELEIGESYFDFVHRKWIDSDAAIGWFERAHHHGNPAAVFLLDGILHSTKGSFFSAFDQFLGAAKGGNSFAQYILGECFIKGRGTEVNFFSGLFWYRKAANQGSVHAQLRVAQLVDQISFLSNPQEAFRWCSQAALSKHPRALCSLADAYRNGRGVEQNPAMACELYRTAALKGDEQAQNILKQWGLR